MMAKRYVSKMEMPVYYSHILNVLCKNNKYLVNRC